MMEALTINHQLAPVAISDVNFIMKPFDRLHCFDATRKYKIGVLRKMDMMLPCRANQRALSQSVDTLRNLGHTIVELDIDQTLYQEAYQIAYYVMLGDGNMRATYELYAGEPLIDHFDKFVEAACSGGIKKRLTQWKLKSQNRLRELMRWRAADHPLSYYEMCNITAKLASLQLKMAQEWDRLGIDAVISPATAGVAVKHNTAMNCFSAICYTFVWNMLDYSAGVAPVTEVQVDEQTYDEPSLFGSKDIEYTVMQEQLIDSAGLPVGIQVITRPYADEDCLNIMRQIGKQTAN